MTFVTGMEGCVSGKACEIGRMEPDGKLCKYETVYPFASSN
jgi:hypothetical protein